MKGIFKGFKFFSQIFVYKEHEMVIGYPTDVKHVAHIGYGGSDNAPSWMTEFKTASDFSSGIFGETREVSWASHVGRCGEHTYRKVRLLRGGIHQLCTDFDQPRGFQSSPGNFSEKSCPDVGRVPKKKRKKIKFTSSTS